MSSDQIPSFVTAAIRQSTLKRLAAAAANFKLPEVPVSSAGIDGLRALRAKQRRSRMQQLRTGN